MMSMQPQVLQRTNKRDKASIKQGQTTSIKSTPKQTLKQGGFIVVQLKGETS